MMDKKKKEDYEKQMLINELERMPARVIATAHLHALNYELYGVDVTDKWQTAVQNADNLQHAYLRGRSDEAKMHHDVVYSSINKTEHKELEMEPDFVPEPIAFLRQYQGKMFAYNPDSISRLAAIEVFERRRAYIGHNMERAVGKAFLEMLDDVGKEVCNLPPAPEPVITHEKAIEYLQSTGWMQNHDREMTLYGAKLSIEDPDLAAIKAAALQAGFEGKEVRFYIGGRLFAIRELPQ